jgi:hypothetical protein
MIILSNEFEDMLLKKRKRDGQETARRIPTSGMITRATNLKTRQGKAKARRSGDGKANSDFRNDNQSNEFEDTPGKRRKRDSQEIPIAKQAICHSSS